MNRIDVSLVSDLPPFAAIAKDALQDLVNRAAVMRVEKNARVFGQGDAAHSFFLLLDGTIRVVKLTPNGEQVIARYIPSGELLGLAEPLGLEHYPASAVAAVDCILLAWPNAIWAETIAIHPAFATATYKTVGTRLQEAQERIIEMATERVEQRVATALVNLSARTGRQTEDGILIDFPISRQDISEMTGTTLHTVSRLLSAWETSGYVKSGRRKITVSQTDALSRIAHGEKTSVS